MARRAVIHLNIADFAVQVERLKDRSLKDWPIIIAPQVSARSLTYDMSEEAFKSGVRKFMPLSRAQKLCREAKVLPRFPTVAAAAGCMLPHRFPLHTTTERCLERADRGQVD